MAIDPVTEVSTDVPAALAAEEPAAAPTAADDGPAGGGLPGYAWLALLAGMIGFSLLRRAVFESATGIRPDGVLAQIQRLNAERRGSNAAAWADRPGALVALSAVGGFVWGATKTVGSKLSGAVGKLKKSKGNE